MSIPLPYAVATRAEFLTHPGLLLDKYSDTWYGVGGFNGELQKVVVREVANRSVRPPDLDWGALHARRHHVLSALGATVAAATTAGPLTLHLARAAALENAGVCLHPIYGFAYLPGTGLKGLARAYAETIAGASPAEIQLVFGHTSADDAAAGAVVFHDAWPEQWPTLIHDLVNSHHADYYGASPDDKKHPPGDWEEPNMVSFLAIPAGTTYIFPISLRRPTEAGGDTILALARRWLWGGLTQLGAGAKTAAGYGDFDVRDPAAWGGKLPDAPKASFTATLTLTTPAFLAGAGQTADDCDLRPATLRGVLRWWWRTMHAGYVDVPTLRRMEATVWGDTHSGGAMRVIVRPNGSIAPRRFDRRTITRENKLPNPPNQKTAQGLTYFSYGTDDAGKHRHYLAPGTSWGIRAVARSGEFTRLDRQKKVVRQPSPPVLSAEELLDQARAALWLLCHFGGVGTKARKGFGSFALPGELADWTLERCEAAATGFRQACGVDAPFNVNMAASPALNSRLTFADVATTWKNYWLALDQVGDSVQRFAQGMKHDRTKMGLGLPRKIGHPRRGTFDAQFQERDRHASPVWYHLLPGNTGMLLVRVVAFPAPRLPNLVDSQTLLKQLLNHLAADLPARFALPLDKPVWNPPPVNAPKPITTGAPPIPVASVISAGGVEVEILERKQDLNGKPSFRVKEVALAKAGMLSYGKPPAELPPVGTVIRVYRNNNNLNNPQYRWDPPQG